VALQVAPPFGGLLLMAAFLLLGAGLSAAAGYQVVARSTRPESAFRGPSPALLLGLQLVLSVAFGLAWLVLGVPDPTSSAFGFIVISVTLLVTYVVVVWLFGIRTGALTWHDLGLPTNPTMARVLRDIGLGAVTMLVVWPAVTALAAILAVFLDSHTVQVVPEAQSLGDVLLTALGAGILVPMGEELFFRGYALTAWLRDRGPRSALIRSTLFFAFAHVLGVTAGTFDEGVRQAVLTVVVITPVGAALGLLFLRRGLVASIAGHATFNLISVLVVSLAQLLPPSGPPAG
jgi:membrane protease YdiL (CAAX protease family)